MFNVNILSPIFLVVALTLLVCALRDINNDVTSEKPYEVVANTFYR